MTFYGHPRKTENQGNRWSAEEEAKLLEELAADKSIDDIADEHKRTEGGIRSRITQIACNRIEAGESMELVIQATKMTEKQILESVNKRAPKALPKAKRRERRTSRRAIFSTYCY